MLTSPARSGRVFGTRFDSHAAIALDGGTITGTASLSAPGSLVCDSGGNISGATFAAPHVMNEFFNLGGSIRIRLTPTITSSSVGRFFTFAKNGDSNFNIAIAVDRANGTIYSQVQHGASRYYATNTGTLSNGVLAEVVVTWSPAGVGRLEVFVNSSSVAVDTTASASPTITGENVNLIYVGRSSSAGLAAFIGTIHAVDVFVGRTALSTTEQTKLAANTLLPPVLSLAKMHLPFYGTYNDDGNLRTRNLGSWGGSDPLVGNGTTSTTFPAFIEPGAIKVDGGDYIDTGVDPAINYNTPFSLAIVAKPKWVTFISQGVISNLDTSISGGRGMEFGFFGGASSNGVRLELFSTSGLGINVNASIPVDFSGIVVATYSGNNNASGCKIFINGLSLSLTQTANNLGTNTTLSGRPLLIGASHNATNKTRFTNNNGVFACPTYWDFELTPTQVQIVTAELTKRARV